MKLFLDKTLRSWVAVVIEEVQTCKLASLANLTADAPVAWSV